MRYVSYRRVSKEDTKRKVKGGQTFDGAEIMKLGLLAQAQAIESFVKAQGGELIADFHEIISGAVDDRPEFDKAKAYAKKHRCCIVVSKLDRLSRDVHFISGLMKDKIQFVVADFGHDADPFMLHMYAALAEKERALIARRTTDALAQLKKQGKKLGAHANPDGIAKGRDVQRQQAGSRARDLLPIIAEVRAAGHSTLAAVADELNRRKIPTPRGGEWHKTSVNRVLARA